MKKDVITYVVDFCEIEDKLGLEGIVETIQVRHEYHDVIIVTRTK